MTERTQSSGETTARRFAAIDIGTVTCRLLVADVDESGLHEIQRGHAITNLGEGVASSGRLLPAAMQRVADQMERFTAAIEACKDEAHPEIQVIALATSAARDAENADEFTALLARYGIELAVIPGQREAELSFRGASSAFAEEPLFVVDVGGGSTEVIAGIAGHAPQLRHSFDIGCRRVTELFLPSDPPTAEELDRARAWIREGMEPFFAEVRASGFEPADMAAVAGTATSVVAIDQQMERYDASRVHLSKIDRATLDGIAERLAAMPLAERREVPGLESGRAPVIVAGFLILQTVMDLAQRPSFTVSETDILHGMILDAAAR